MPPKPKIRQRKLQFFHTRVCDHRSERATFDYFKQPSTEEASDGERNRTDHPTAPPDVLDSAETPLVVEAVKPTQTFRSRKADSVKAWQNIRSKLRSAYYQSIVPTSEECDICHEEIPNPVFCCDCSTQPVFCEDCAVQSHHQNAQFHKLLQYKDGTRCRFEFRRELSTTTHNCDEQYMKSMTIFERNGSSFSCQVTFCRCLTEMESLVKFGYWPSSPVDPANAISMNLLQWMTGSLLETNSSVKSICQSLKVSAGLNDGEVTYLYRTLTNETFEEYRHFRFCVSNTPLESTDIDDGASCPACPKEGGEAFISLDANFGLVRKKNSGSSNEPPKHASRYFIEQNIVDSFVEAYDADGAYREDDKECSNFQAASAVRAKNKAANLDATGVFGSACRHGIPHIFLSMCHGERYAYPALLLKTLVEGCSVHYHVIYDIACKFDGHIQKRMPWLSGFDVALPVFHAYGHKLPCQILYSTRWKTNYGLTDGECMERLWSYLRKFSHVTKEMTPSHRIDLLSDALFHFASGKIANIGNALCMSLQKGRDVANQSQCQLQQVCSSHNVSVEAIKQWRQEAKDQLTQHGKSKRHKQGWKETYVIKLQYHQHLCTEILLCEDQEQVMLLNSHIRQVLNELRAIEEKNGISSRWTCDSSEYIEVEVALQSQKMKMLKEKMRCQAVEYSYLKEISRKYSDGQAIAQRVSRQLIRASRSLKKSIKTYNEEFLPQPPIPYTQAADPSNEFYHHLHEMQQQSSDMIPARVKQNAVDALNMNERGLEEQRLVTTEMKNSINFFKQQIERIESQLSRLNTVAMQEEENGICCLLREKAAYYKKLMETCSEQFRRAIGGYIGIDANEVLLSDDDEDLDETID